MSRLEAKFVGSVVAEPELKETKNGVKKLEFPVYVNHSRKNKDSGEYAATGDVTKIRVTLWGDKVDFDVRRSDLVEVVATLVEKEFDKRDGSKGRSLQTEFVESINVKFRKSGMAATPLSTGVSESWIDNEDAPF